MGFINETLVSFVIVPLAMSFVVVHLAAAVLFPDFDRLNDHPWSTYEQHEV